MKAASVVLSVLLVFATVARAIWLECAAVACAYDVRRLRESEADLRNQNEIMRADIARCLTSRRLSATAQTLGLGDLQDETVVTVSRPPQTEWIDVGD